MSLPPQTLRRLLRELNKLTTSPPEGIRLAKETFNSNDEDGEAGGDGEADLSNVNAWVEGPDRTPFEGGYFKIRFSFGSDYPAQPPKCTFVTKIFHPNVNPSDGAICVSTLKKDWKPEYGIEYILTVIKCLLIHPNPASALHAEAGRLLLEDFEDYANRAKLMTSIHAVSKSGPPIEFKDASSFSNASSIPKPSTSTSTSKSSSTSSTIIPIVLQTSTFSNTSSASPSSISSTSTSTVEKPLSAGKKRSVSNVSNNLEVSSSTPGGVEKPKIKKSSSTGSGEIVKKRGLKRL